jgi:hypothetical protein
MTFLDNWLSLMHAIVQLPILDKPALQWQFANVILKQLNVKVNYVDFPPKNGLSYIYANEQIKNPHTHISHITY